MQPRLRDLRLNTLRCNSNIVGSKLPWYESCMVKLSNRAYSKILAPRVAGQCSRVLVADWSNVGTNALPWYSVMGTDHSVPSLLHTLVHQCSSSLRVSSFCRCKLRGTAQRSTSSAQPSRWERGITCVVPRCHGRGQS